MSPTITLHSEQVVDEGLSFADRDMLEHFLGARRRARGPIVCLNDHAILTNAAATSVVRKDDHHVLWAWAQRAIRQDDRSVHALQLGDLQLSAQCEPISAESNVVGAMIRLGTSANGSRRASEPKPSRESVGWESLRESELGIAQLVADGLTNREVGAQLFMSRHTVDFHLRQIFRKLGISSRVELTRLVVEHGIPSAP